MGLIIDRVEVYSGYEYLDIDNYQINAVMAGVRVWFQEPIRKGRQAPRGKRFLRCPALFGSEPVPLFG